MGAELAHGLHDIQPLRQRLQRCSSQQVTPVEVSGVSIIPGDVSYLISWAKWSG